MGVQSLKIVDRRFISCRAWGGALDITEIVHEINCIPPHQRNWTFGTDQ